MIRVFQIGDIVRLKSTSPMRWYCSDCSISNQYRVIEVNKVTRMVRLYCPHDREIKVAWDEIELVLRKPDADEDGCKAGDASLGLVGG